MIKPSLVAILLFVFTARFAVLAQDSSSRSGDSLRLSEETLITAHNFLDGCAEALDGLGPIGSFAKGGAKGAMNLALPSELGVMRRQMAVNHSELLRQLGAVNTRLESIGMAIDEVKRSVEAEAEEQLYVKCRTLYADLIENKKNESELRSSTSELEKLVLDARHMHELRPRGIVFYLSLCNASLCVAKINEARSMQKLGGTPKLAVIATRIEEILDSCEQKGTYNDSKYREIASAFFNCRDRTYSLMTQAGLAPCKECNSDTLNQFCFRGREQDGPPDVEITIFPYRRVEKFSFKNVSYVLEVKGPLVSTLNGYERFKPVSIAGLKQGSVSGAAANFDVTSDEVAAKTPMVDRVRPLIDAYNQSVAATNSACASLLIADAAKKLGEFSRRALSLELAAK